MAAFTLLLTLAPALVRLAPLGGRLAPSTPRRAAPVLASAEDPNLFEQGMRAVTGNKDYKFGDLTKNATATAVETLSGKTIDEYEFGDITKRFASEAADVATDVVTKYTGKEDYEFGDLTKKLFTDVDSNLEKLREDTFNELPSALWQQLFGSLDAKQRKELAIAVVQWAALVLVAFALVSAAATGFSVAAAWTIASARAGASPLAPGRWPAFLAVHATLRLALDPVMLPLRFGGAIAGVRSTRRAVFAVEKVLPFRGTPVLGRLIAIVAALLLPAAAVAAGTALAILVGGAVVGVPAFVV